MTQYNVKDYNNLLGMNGFSDIMISNHLTLYKGYVDNANKLIGLLDSTERGSYTYAELKRRLAWELNGIKLHELYFDNLCNSNNNQDPAALMGEKTRELLSSQYGNLDEWQASLKRNGMIRGIGWIVLTLDGTTGSLYHNWIAEHSNNVPVDGRPILVMDMWEHAYMTDYGIKKADYIDAFIKNINWSKVEERINSK